MGDQRTRSLERAGGGDPEARAAFLKELQRTRDPRLLEVEQLEERLRAMLRQVRSSLNQLLTFGQPAGLTAEETLALGDCKELPLRSVRVAVETALLSRPFMELGYGYKSLARVYPGGRPNWDEIDEIEQLNTPWGVLAFAARSGEEVLLHVGFSESRKPTPGTVWGSLRPWRETQKPETLEGKILRWIDDTRPVPEAECIPLDLARLWIELAQLGASEGSAPAEPGLGRASEKQLNFIASLRRQKGLEPDLAFKRYMRGVLGVEALALIGRGQASELIEDLLSLRNERQPKASTAAKAPAGDKQPWEGQVTSIRPRIKLTRIRGEEQHGYQGYALHLEGLLSGDQRTFSVGLGKAAQAKHGFQVGDTARGVALPVADPSHDAVDYYRVSKLQRVGGEPPEAAEPPWLGPPPPLETYRARGHRPLGNGMLEQAPCATCYWGCRMPVEDKGSEAKTIESHCYGPEDCSAYAPF